PAMWHSARSQYRRASCEPMGFAADLDDVGALHGAEPLLLLVVHMPGRPTRVGVVLLDDEEPSPRVARRPLERERHRPQHPALLLEPATSGRNEEPPFCGGIHRTPPSTRSRRGADCERIVEGSHTSDKLDSRTDR